MEEKHLNLNAPLLSVRRFSSTLVSSREVNRIVSKKSQPSRQHSLPLYKSDWELGEVTKPAAVPFVWERIPGKPKGESKAQLQPPAEPSNSPRLPPGRVLGATKHLSDEKSEDQNASRPQIEASPLNGNGTLLESLNKGVKVKENSDSESADDAYSDAYSDALDTLSPEESFSLNYSVSGLSGYDGPDVKPSGTFSTDPQTRDFMMSRFLPAAKAMVLETSQYVSRKQPVAMERPTEVKKVVHGERRPLLEQYRSNILSHYGPSVEDVESEDEDDEYDDPGKISRKVCGFLPRFCVKNSLCLLNPVPGLKSRAHAPLPSAGEVRKMTRTAYSGPLEKHTWDAVYKKKLHSGFQSGQLHVVERKLTAEFNQFSSSSNSYMTDGSSPHRHSRAGGVSPYRNETSRSPFHDGARFLGMPKEVENVKAKRFSSFETGCNNFQDISSPQIYEQGSDSGSLAVEKTLYVDYVNNVEPPILDSVSSDAEGLMNSSNKNFETSVEGRRMEQLEQASTAKSSIKDLRCLNLLEQGGLLKPNASGSFDVDLPSFTCISNVKSQVDRMEGLKLDQGLAQESGSLECSGVHSNGNLWRNSEQSIKANDQGNSNMGFLQSPLTPPLPKSPSESWLWRTLPSISLGNPFSQPHLSNQFRPKKQVQRTSTADTKWETMVKTSNLHHDHVRYSEELIPHVSQHSKT